MGASCMRCRHASLTLVEPGRALMQLICGLSGGECGAGCEALEARDAPMTDPRGAGYSLEWRMACEARLLFRLEQCGRSEAYLAGVRKVRGDAAAAELARMAASESRDGAGTRYLDLSALGDAPDGDLVGRDARYVLSLPDKKRRHRELDRLGLVHGSDYAHQVREEVFRLWELLR